jgi:anti-sigma B factor antagonist
VFKTVSEDGEPDPASAYPAPLAARCSTVRMPAEVDIANADDLRQSLMAAVDHGSAIVIADMSDTMFCDCAAVTALVVAAQYAAAAGAELRVAATSRPVLRTLEITGLPRLLAIYPTANAAAAEHPNGRPRPASFRGVTELSSRRGTRHRRSGPPQGQPRPP